MTARRIPRPQPAAMPAAAVPLAAALLALALALGVGVGAAQAAPAPWYQWRSKIDGAMVCAQTPLGPGWERAGGPYRDSHCTKPALAK